MTKNTKGKDFFYPNTVVTEKDIQKAELQTGKFPPKYSKFILQYKVGFGNLNKNKNKAVSSHLENKEYRLWELNILIEIQDIMKNLENFYPSGHQIKFGLIQIGLGNHTGEKYFLGNQDWNMDMMYMIDTNEVFDDLEDVIITEEMKIDFDNKYKIANDILEFVEGLCYDIDE